VQSVQIGTPTISLKVEPIDSFNCHIHAQRPKVIGSATLTSEAFWLLLFIISAISEIERQIMNQKKCTACTKRSSVEHRNNRLLYKTILKSKKEKLCCCCTLIKLDSGNTRSKFIYVTRYSDHCVIGFPWFLQEYAVVVPKSVLWPSHSKSFLLLSYPFDTNTSTLKVTS
jgi:hypothetical protein